MLLVEEQPLRRQLRGEFLEAGLERGRRLGPNLDHHLRRGVLAHAADDLVDTAGHIHDAVAAGGNLGSYRARAQGDGVSGPGERRRGCRRSGSCDARRGGHSRLL